MSAVEVRHLTKQFTRRHVRVTALDGISFTIDRGECLALVGPSGAGKSTLVDALSTRLAFDGGSATVFGRDVAREERAVRRAVNRVSAEPSFLRHLPALDNLVYAARFYGLPARWERRTVADLLDLAGLEAGRRDTPMESLAPAMRQRVALVRTLLVSPALLLLDEPTRGLAPGAADDVRALVRRIAREHDTTTLLCTADPGEAAALADRVGILDRGRLLAAGGEEPGEQAA